MINLDPKLVDQETIRKNKRKRLLKIAALPCVLLLILTLMAARQSSYNAFFGLVIKNNETGFANILTQMQIFANYAEPHIAHYNEGIIRLKNRQYTEAEQSFRTSLENDPPERAVCDIYNNLAISMELQADELVKTKTYEKAIELYTHAESILISSGCGSNEDNKKHEKSNATAERVSEKRSEAIANKNKFSGSAGAGSNQGGTSIDEGTLKKIKESQSMSNSGAINVRNSLGKDGFSYKPNHISTPW